MWTILLIVCAAGALVCDKDHNAFAHPEGLHEEFKTVDACEARVAELMEANPPPATIVGKMICVGGKGA